MQNHFGKINKNSLDLLELFRSVKIQFHKKKLYQNKKGFILKKIVVECEEDLHFHKLNRLKGDFVVSHLLNDCADFKG